MFARNYDKGQSRCHESTTADPNLRRRHLLVAEDELGELGANPSPVKNLRDLSYLPSQFCFSID